VLAIDNEPLIFPQAFEIVPKLLKVPKLLIIENWLNAALPPDVSPMIPPALLFNNPELLKTPFGSKFRLPSFSKVPVP